MAGQMRQNSWHFLLHSRYSSQISIAHSILFMYLCARTAECVMDLDKQSEMIIFGSILTTFELSSIF